MTNWHIITCEYPPQVGGVSDYTKLLAREMRRAGDEVQVWAPAFASAEEPNVHRDLGAFLSRDLRHADEILDRTPKPRTLLLQWVPHGYGKRGVNLGFARWITARVRGGDRLYVMVHEPFLPYRGPWKHRLVSLLQRRMLRELQYSATRVFMSIPAWEAHLQPYARPPMKFEWLPIPATIDSSTDPQRVAQIRASHGNDLMVGHLGTYSAELRPLVGPAMLKVLRDVPNAHSLLLGNRSDAFAAELRAQWPEFADRIHGEGLLSGSDLANHIAAFDLALQPFPDGLTTRRTSLMNVISRGVPVVSNLGHLTEQLWSDSQAVALASTSEPTQVAVLAAQLLHDENARRQLGAAGRGLYISRFDWPNIIATLRSSTDVAHATIASTSSNQSDD